MNKLVAPYPWFGGKSTVAPLIWERLGDVPNLVIPFFGSGAELWARPHWDIAAGRFKGKPYRTETVNDLDGHIANFTRAIKHSPDQVAWWASDPINETDLHARHPWLMAQRTELEKKLRADPDYYDAKIAGWWVWGLCQWIGGEWCLREKSELSDDGGDVTTKQRRPDLSGKGVFRTKQQRPHLAEGMGIFRTFQQLPSIGQVGRGIFRESNAENLSEYFAALSARLSRVRVCAGNWDRVLGPSVTYGRWLTGVVLDPPYSTDANRDSRLYGAEDGQVAHAVREWCLADITTDKYSGPRYRHPKLRIALCGYESEHNMPDDWICISWTTQGGYGLQRKGEENTNRYAERIWFSPHCLSPEKDSEQLTLL